MRRKSIFNGGEKCGEKSKAQIKEETKRFRRDRKGADNAQEQRKFYWDDDGEKYKVQFVLRERIKCMREKNM